MASLLQRRRGLAILLPVAYVAGAAMYAGEERPLAWGAIAAAAVIAAGRA